MGEHRSHTIFLKPVKLGEVNGFVNAFAPIVGSSLGTLLLLVLLQSVRRWSNANILALRVCVVMADWFKLCALINQCTTTCSLT